VLVLLAAAATATAACAVTVPPFDPLQVRVYVVLDVGDTWSVCDDPSAVADPTLLLIEPDDEFAHEYVSVDEFPDTMDVGEREMDDAAGAGARVPVALPVLPVAAVLVFEPEPMAALQRLLMALPISCEPMPPPEAVLALEQSVGPELEEELPGALLLGLHDAGPVTVPFVSVLHGPVASVSSQVPSEPSTAITFPLVSYFALATSVVTPVHPAPVTLPLASVLHGPLAEVSCQVPSESWTAIAFPSASYLTIVVTPLSNMLPPVPVTAVGVVVIE